MGGRGDLFLFSGDMLIYLIRVSKNGTFKAFYVPLWGVGGNAKWGKPVAKWQTAKNQEEPASSFGLPPHTTILNIVSQITSKLADTYYRDNYSYSFLPSSFSISKARKNLRIINAPKS